VAADADMAEEDLQLTRTEGRHSEPLESYSIKEVKAWIKSSRSESTLPR
jgi:hypothetical protein